MVEVDSKEARVLAATQRQETAPSPLPAGLEGLFRQYHRMVFDAAYRVTGSSADAEDVLQTVFTRLLRRERAGEASLDGIGSSYLHHAAVNAALDVLRSRATWKQAPIEGLRETLADETAARPDRTSESEDLKAALRGALARLKPAAATIFALRFIEGRPNHEIARLLGRPQVFIAVTLHRARKQLQHELRRQLEGHHDAA